MGVPDFGGPVSTCTGIDGGPYTYYQQILDDIQISRQRVIMVLMNLDDTPAWSSATPFQSWDSINFNYPEFTAFVYDCALAAGFDGISLDVEHRAVNSNHYWNLMKKLGKYFGRLSSNADSMIYTGAFYSGGAPGPIFRENELSQYLNFVMDMAYFQNNDSRFAWWANALDNSKVMIGMSHETNSSARARPHW